MRLDQTEQIKRRCARKLKNTTKTKGCGNGGRLQRHKPLREQNLNKIEKLLNTHSVNKYV